MSIFSKNMFRESTFAKKGFENQLSQSIDHKMEILHFVSLHKKNFLTLEDCWYYHNNKCPNRITGKFTLNCIFLQSNKGNIGSII